MSQMICRVCHEPIDGPQVEVARRDGPKVQLFYLHMACFEQKYDEFREWKHTLPEGFEVKPKKEEPLLTKEEQIDEYKHRAMSYFEEAQEEKKGEIWLKIVNNPGCYFAVRQLISLRGADMSVELFEEIAAIFVVLMKHAHMENMAKLKVAENIR